VMCSLDKVLTMFLEIQFLKVVQILRFSLYVFIVL